MNGIISRDIKDINGYKYKNGEISTQTLNWNSNNIGIVNGFNKEETKEWLEVKVFPNSSYFSAWLRDEKKFIPLNLRDYSDSDWKALNNEWKEYWKNFVTCDHCLKKVQKNNTSFSDREENIDFCSEDCQLPWDKENLRDVQKYLDLQLTELREDK